MTIPELLRGHFDRTGEEQATFARRLGLTPQTVSQLVRGDIKVPTANVRRKIARAFDLRHVDILVMVGELAEDEVPQEGAPRELFPKGSPHAKVIQYLHELDNDQALEVARYCLFQIEHPLVDVPVIVAGGAR